MVRVSTGVVHALLASSRPRARTRATNGWSASRPLKRAVVESVVTAFASSNDASDASCTR
jgi:hypothetical protein